MKYKAWEIPVDMFLDVWTWEAEASLQEERRIKYVQRGAEMGNSEKEI